MPRRLGDAELGSDLIEVGPGGPGWVARLQTLGYERITRTVDYALTFRAYRPGP